MFFVHIENVNQPKPNHFSIIEEIDDTIIEHLFSNRKDAFDTAQLLIDNPPVCDKHRVVFKSKYSKTSTVLYDGKPNKTTEVTADNYLPSS